MLWILACRPDETDTRPKDTDPGQLPVAIVPAPAALTRCDGAFSLDAGTAIVAASGTEAVAEQLAAELRIATGLDLPIAEAGAITLTVSDDATAPEGYTLDVDDTGVHLLAADLDGLYWAGQTLRQLLPVTGDPDVPCVQISDQPRYAERGLMIDVARHFFTIADLERQVDVMALHKLNRLHVHLTDDQGWRIEIPGWPDLTTIGGSTEVGGGPGGFYTLDEFQGLVDYAAARHVTVIPEVDFPGHANAAVASYAELNESGVRAELYTGEGVISTPLWLDGPATAGFVADVWTAVAELSPTGEVHIGGDEAVDIAEPEYAAFLVELQGMLDERGVWLTGWDEIGGSGLRAPFRAQWWWHEDEVVEAVAEGATVLSSPADHAYFDMVHDEEARFGQVWAGAIDLEKAWDWDPTPPGVDGSAVDGVEGALWTEYIDSVERMDLMLWPRSAALAEVGWSERGTWEDFATRMVTDGERLEALGVGFYRTPEVDWGSATP